MGSYSKNKAMMIILSAPSGGGKTSISKKLLEADGNLFFSISATTREARSGEQEGVHYFFTKHIDFDRMVTQGEFLEHTNIYGNSYGTPKNFVEKKLSEGMDVLFDIDSNGAYQIMDKVGKQAVSIFITPPSISALESRLKSRAQDSQSMIERRLKVGEKEIEQAKNYDYIVVNDDLDKAVKEVQDIIVKERKERKN